MAYQRQCYPQHNVTELWRMHNVALAVTHLFSVQLWHRIRDGWPILLDSRLVHQVNDSGPSQWLIKLSYTHLA
jgi:hypothetical protein